jgi:hypothetical protein
MIRVSVCFPMHPSLRGLRSVLLRILLSRQCRYTTGALPDVPSFVFDSQMSRRLSLIPGAES